MTFCFATSKNPTAPMFVQKVCTLRVDAIVKDFYMESPHLNSSLVEVYFNNATEKLDNVVIRPSKKAPVKIIQCALVFSKQYELNGEICYELTLYALPTGILLIEYTEPRYDEYGNEDHFVKIRKLHNFDDVWTFLQNAEKNPHYINFIENCGKILGDETFFCVPIF